MGLYIRPAYGYVLKRKATEEEINYVMNYSNEDENIIFKYHYDSNVIVFLLRNGKIQHIYEDDTFFIDDLFEYSEERKEKSRSLFKELLERKDLPNSLKNISDWEENFVINTFS